MNAFLYGLALQWKLDLRSKTLLITCYIVPLLFFGLMGGIFTALLPGARDTLIPSMTVMGISMGALVGVPPSLVEIYSSPIKNAYKANGVPLYIGLATINLSAFLHLMIMSAILFLVAPLAFGAALPANLPAYFAALAFFTAVSLGVGSVLGLAVKSQAKLTMVSQLVFLPSIMLSGIMFSAELLPGVLRVAGKLFPASWGYAAMLDHGFRFETLWPLAAFFAAAAAACGILLHALRDE